MDTADMDTGRTSQERQEGQGVSLPKTEKLTEWEKEPSVMSLKEDLEAARPFHDAHMVNVRRWNDLRNVTGTAKPKPTTVCPRVSGHASTT